MYSYRLLGNTPLGSRKLPQELMGKANILSHIQVTENTRTRGHEDTRTRGQVNMKPEDANSKDTVNKNRNTRTEKEEQDHKEETN